MKVIDSESQLEDNLAELERCRLSQGEDLIKYRRLIQRGKCFWPYVSPLGLSFAPSRFIGYKNNTIDLHWYNTQKDGRVTNHAINTLFHSIPRPNDTLELAYINFCKSIGVNPAQDRDKRKFWINYNAKDIIEKHSSQSIEEDSNLKETEKKQLIDARCGQGIFRNRIIKMWGKCCITHCDFVEILVASHIKPWRDSNNEERLDSFNGLLLSPNIDALFDKGFISFSNDGVLLTSCRLPNSTLTALGCPHDAKVQLQQEHIDYISWHRENIFINNKR